MVKYSITTKTLNPLVLVWASVAVARPVHWIKNASVFAALVLTGNLFSSEMFERVLWTFVAFSLAASATYVFNDIFDREADRMHPIKRNRPIASGRLPVVIAWILAVGFAAFSLAIANVLMPLVFFLILGYLLLQIAYSLFLKHLVILDILVIASGFVIRVYSGAFVIDAHLSVWFLLCVISVALFLGSGKRRAELGVLETASGITRKSLTKYTQPLLDSYVTMFGNAAWLSWALFTFFESPHAARPVWVFLAEIRYHFFSAI